MNQADLINEIKEWILEAGENIKSKLKDPLVIEHKSSRTDLVTNIDKETEKFFVDHIRKKYPEDKILGEEGLGDELTSLAGRVWIIDPIDGTMNFVKQQENFCIMLAVYEEGIGQLGFIYNLMNNEFVWGGKGLGVYLNDQKLPNVANLSLEEGIIGMNSVMYAKNQYNSQLIGDASAAVRMMGCAGLEFIQLIRGKEVAYLSMLAPWDFAPGYILSKELGLVNTKITGEPVNFLEKSFYVVATAKAHEDIQRIIHQ